MAMSAANSEVVKCVRRARLHAIAEDRIALEESLEGGRGLGAAPRPQRRFEDAELRDDHDGDERDAAQPASARRASAGRRGAHAGPSASAAATASIVDAGSAGCSGSEKTSRQTSRRDWTRGGLLVGERGLFGQRVRIVNQRLDPLRPQMGLHALSRRGFGPGRGDTRVRHRAPAARRWCARRRAPAGTPPQRCRRAVVQDGRNGRRARSTAACISSSREFTPNSVWRYLSACPPLRSRAARAATAASLVTIAPASPSAPRFLVG